MVRYFLGQCKMALLNRFQYFATKLNSYLTRKINQNLTTNGYPLTKINTIIKKFTNIALKSTKTVDEPKKLSMKMQFG